MDYNCDTQVLKSNHDYEHHGLIKSGKGFDYLSQTEVRSLEEPLLPIDDFHLLDYPVKYNDEERQLRIKLTAVYRLIERNGWSMGIYNHVTVSVLSKNLTTFRRRRRRRRMNKSDIQHHKPVIGVSMRLIAHSSHSMRAPDMSALMADTCTRTHAGTHAHTHTQQVVRPNANQTFFLTCSIIIFLLSILGFHSKTTEIHL